MINKRSAIDPKLPLNFKVVPSNPPSKLTLNESLKMYNFMLIGLVSIPLKLSIYSDVRL